MTNADKMKSRRFRWLSKATISEREWVQAKPGKFKYFCFSIARLWYRIFPSFSKSFTISGFLIGLGRLSLVILIALVPIIVGALSGSDFSGSDKTAIGFAKNPIYQAMLLVLLQFLKIVLDRLKMHRTIKNDRLRSLSDLSVALSAALQIVERHIRALARGQRAQAELDSVLGQALKCVEATVKLCTDNLDDRYCCVTLLTFEPNDQVKVRARSLASRRTGAFIDRGQTIAYSVALYASNAKAINHFKREARIRKENTLNYRSISIPGRPPYESILALPLPSVSNPAQTGEEIRKGVVTIDAALPYEFLGRETEIVIRVQPYLELINLILSNHNTGIQPEIRS